jgi:hypothetical protein
MQMFVERMFPGMIEIPAPGFLYYVYVAASTFVLKPLLGPVILAIEAGIPRIKEAVPLCKKRVQIAAEERLRLGGILWWREPQLTLSSLRLQ